MQIKRAGRIHYVAADFKGPACTVQGFTTRHEGVSRPPYNSLNLGLGTKDQQHSVEGNRSLLTRAFGVPQESLVTVRQVHGSDILVINEPNEEFSHFLQIESDAIVTNQPGVMIGVCVADCVPILIADTRNRVVAAVHAGWQGTAQALVVKTIEAMISMFGCKAEELQVLIGPSIGKCCYEVDAPVKNAMQQSGVLWEMVAEEAGAGKWRLDLAEANRRLLVSAGISAEALQASDMCVCCQKELFFSHRRDNGDTGRQMGFIMLKTP